MVDLGEHDGPVASAGKEFLSQPCERATMIRRSFLAGAAAATLAPSLARAQGLTPLSVATSPDEDAVACLYGNSSGIFRKYGLDVTVTAANSGAAISNGVVGGSIDIGKASLLGLIAGYTKGVPFTLIAPASMYSSAAPVAGTLASDSAIRTAADLSGKTVSVQSLKGFLQIALMKWIDEHGGDSNAVHYIELSPSAASAALLAGRVDAATLANPSLAATLGTKKARVFAWTAIRSASTICRPRTFPPPISRRRTPTRSPVSRAPSPNRRPTRTRTRLKRSRWSQNSPA